MKKLILAVVAAMAVTTASWAQPHVVYSLLADDVRSISITNGTGVTNMNSKWLLPSIWMTNGSYYSWGCTNLGGLVYTNTLGVKYIVSTTNITYTGATTNGVTSYDTRNTGYRMVWQDTKNLLDDVPLWAPRDAAQVQGISYPPVGTTNIFCSLQLDYWSPAASNNVPIAVRLSVLPDGTNENCGTPYTVTFTPTGVTNMTTTLWAPIPAYLFNTAAKIRCQSINADPATETPTTNHTVWIRGLKLVGFQP